MTAAAELEVRRGRRSLTLTRLDRVLWPERDVRKRDLVAYYREIAPLLLPHLRARPFTIRRHFTVPRGPFVWEKDAPAEMPSWIRTCPQPARSRGGALVRYPLVQDELALLWMVEYGCVDMHAWTSRCDRPERPDFVLFDCDPAGVTFAEVARGALLLREALDAAGLESFVRTSGGEGLHVLVPVARVHDHAEAREFANVISRAVARASRGLVTLERARERRHGVFVDTKMNGHGQQVVSPYSVRPLPGAPVATPLRWDELDGRLDPGGLTPEVVLERARAHGDLHAAVLQGRQRLRAALARVT